MEIGLMITVWLVSMLLNLEAYLLNKSTTSLVAGAIFALAENILLLYLGINGLYIVLPISIISFFACLKASATIKNITITSKGNAAQIE